LPIEVTEEEEDEEDEELEHAAKPSIHQTRIATAVAFIKKL
jgi:hypothetical protein